MVEELKSRTYKDLCSTCGIDKNKPRDLVILDCNPLSYALDLDSRCPECEHYASGQTLLSLKEWKYKLINKAEERGRKEGAITFCKSLIERFEKERIVLENERIVLEQTMRQNHYTDLDFSNALINIGKLLQLKEVLKEIKRSEKVNGFI